MKAFQEVLTLERTNSAETDEVATALNDLAFIKHCQGDYIGAEQDQREALQIAKQRNRQPIVAMYTCNMARLALQRRDWTAAEGFTREALQLERVAPREMIGEACMWLAKALSRQGRPQQGQSYAKRGRNLHALKTAQ